MSQTLSEDPMLLRMCSLIANIDILDLSAEKKVFETQLHREFIARDTGGDRDGRREWWQDPATSSNSQ